MPFLSAVSQSNVTLQEYAAKDVGDIEREFHTHTLGLLSAEAMARFDEYGANVFEHKKEQSIILEYLSHFASPMTLVLLFAAAMTFYLGEFANTTIICLMVFMSSTVDFVQEHRAIKQASRLAQSVQVRVTVMRDGVQREIPATEVVPGDILILSAGDIVPADARIVECNELFVNQSSFTGESYPSSKVSTPIPKAQTILDLANIVLCGTTVTSGFAKALVLKTGAHTEFGKLAKSLDQTVVHSAFDTGMRSFGFVILKTAIVLVLFIFFYRSLMSSDILQSLVFAIAVAVGLVPELLPMILTVTMSSGSARMAKKGAIVKKLRSIPNLGSMDILCTDKTGTLTEDRIDLVNYVDAFSTSSDLALEYAYVNSFFQTGLKNPLDEAVLHYRQLAVSGYQKKDEIPFEFTRKRLSVIVQKERKRLLICKGAPEEMFPLCTHMLKGKKRVKFDGIASRTYQKLSDDGYRVLAIGVTDVADQENYHAADETNLTLVGFVAFLDPPKPDLEATLKMIMDSGVQIKVITGDNERVTRRICTQLNLPIMGILSGSQIDQLSESALAVAAETTTIFSRCSPNQKNRIILALKAKGHVVGYLGDGINDAPALKSADVGISVNSAADIAKESADIVLTQKSLRILHEGLLEGRKTVANSLKFIQMGVSSNFGNMFSLTGAVVLFPWLPMLPVQIILNNLLYDISQLTIPSDNVDAELIKKPRKWDESYLKKFMITFGSVSSLFDFIAFFIMFGVFSLTDSGFQTGWFMLSIATQVLVIYVIRTRRNPFTSLPSTPLVFSTLITLAVAWLIPYTPLGPLLGFVVLPWYIPLSFVVLLFGYLSLVQVAKILFYRYVVKE